MSVVKHLYIFKSFITYSLTIQLTTLVVEPVLSCEDEKNQTRIGKIALALSPALAATASSPPSLPPLRSSRVASSYVLAVCTVTYIHTYVFKHRNTDIYSFTQHMLTGSLLSSRHCFKLGPPLALGAITNWIKKYSGMLDEGDSWGEK